MSKLSKQKQSGGTLVGVILGLIVGLAIAVVVAIMITKTPTPFTNKPAKADKPSDIITAPEQLSDPNKPLYGNRAQASASAVVPAPAGVAVVPPRPPVAPPDLIGQKIQEKQHEASAPIIDKSSADQAKKAAPEMPAAKTDSADDRWIYYLQIGAFREQAEAESARAKLALQGFEAKVSERPSDNGSLYRVRIGAFTSLDTMNRMRRKLSDSGISTAVVRSAK